MSSGRFLGSLRDVHFSENIIKIKSLLKEAFFLGDENIDKNKNEAISVENFNRRLLKEMYDYGSDFLSCDLYDEGLVSIYKIVTNIFYNN